MMRTKCVRWAALGVLTGCLLACGDSGESSGEGEERAASADSGSRLYWAMSGGGWRAHTVDSAYVLAMLHASGEDLTSLTSRVDSGACNSGSCWFHSQLAYSAKFRKVMEDSDTADNFIKDGFLGRFKFLNYQFPCLGLNNTPAQMMCERWPAFQGYFALGKVASGLHWYSIVKDVVYRPLGMNTELKNVTLNGAREDWANGKSLIFAGSLLTERAVLSGGKFNQNYVSTELSTKLDIPTKMLTSTPIFFSSTASTDMKPPDLFSAGDLLLTYNDTSSFSKGLKPLVIKANHPQGNVPVIAAATVSSAAGGIAASKTAVSALLRQVSRILTPVAGQISFVTSALAPSFLLADDGFKLIRNAADKNVLPAALTRKNLAQLKAVRTADGGFSDNTSVAFMLRHLHDNDLLDNFRILAFSNTEEPLRELGFFGEVANDIAALFGVGLVDGEAKMCIGDTCVAVASPQVFALQGAETADTWWRHSSGGTNASLTRYKVTTVKNDVFGVPAGKKGTLYVLTGQSRNAPTVPTSAESFDAYEKLFHGIYDGFKNHGGWDVMERVLKD